MIAGRKICRIKFHRGVEFKFTIEFFQIFSKKLKKGVDFCRKAVII